MLWKIIVSIFWIGVAISFVFTMVRSCLMLFNGEGGIGARMGAFVIIWVFWVLSIVGSTIGLFVTGFVLTLFGIPVRGFTATPR